jgi:hypothetical protein
MIAGVKIVPKVPMVEVTEQTPEVVEKRVGKLGKWIKENKDTILISIATAGLLMQAVRIFKK